MKKTGEIILKMKINKQNQNKNSLDEFKYLDLLEDNSPRYYTEYNAEAAILKKQIDSPGVCNIAVVAKYGAGKSSVIDTYLHNYRRTNYEKKKNIAFGKPEDNKYTRITLSTFNNVEYDETAIERSILQQLLYSRKKSELPNSEIKRTNRTPIEKSLLVALLMTVFIASILIFGIEIAGIRLFGMEANWVKYIFLGIAFLLFFIIVFWLIHYRKLFKIKYRDLEVDISSKEGKENGAYTANLINKFIDEILYYFECINIDLVIFEDLDRLPTTEIFAKLHELNTIINGSRKRGGKVTFLYAVRDDLFKTEEERAKFFEFILPVVPVINPITTGNKLRESIDKMVQKNKDLALTEKFIKGIATYIPDMRILKNTLNDYIIMYSKIFEDTDSKREQLSQENLFALSLYKNLFPYDYVLLETGAGLIPMVVDMNKLRGESLKINEERMAQAKKRLEALNNEKLKSVKELKYVFLGIVQKYSYRGRNTSDPLTPINIMDDKVSFVGLNHSHVAHWQHPQFFINLPAGTSEVLLPDGEHFADRESLIVEKIDNKGKTTMALITQLEKERQEILTRSFSEIIDNQGLDSCFPPNLANNYLETYKLDLQNIYATEISEERMMATNLQEEVPQFFARQIELQIRYLHFLVGNGYIDERYIEYTSNFKAKLITPKDAQFVAEIQAKRGDFDYIPDDISCIIKRLDDDDFKHPAVINKSLLENIELIKILDAQEDTKKYRYLLDMLTKLSDVDVMEKLERYFLLASVEQCEVLLKELVPLCPELCAFLLENGEFDEERNDLIVICAIKYATSQKDQDRNNILSAYIGRHKNYLGLFERVGEKAITFIKETQPIFETLMNNNLNGEIQRYIIENNLYKITLQNLEVIFEVKNTDNITDEFYSRQYSYVLESGKTKVIEYIGSNINQYVSVVLLNEKVSLQLETSAQIETLLKNVSIEISFRIKLIQKCNLKVENILDFNEEFFPAILADGKMMSTWENVFNVYSKTGYTEDLEAYLSKTDLTGEFRNKNALSFYTDILANDKGNSKDIKSILNKIEVQYKLEQFNIDKMLKEHPMTTSYELGEIKIVDKNFSAAIELGQILFSNTDWPRLYTLPYSRHSYLKKYESKILAEFDTFFSNILPRKSKKNVLKNNQYVVIEEYIEPSNANLLISDTICADIVPLKVKQALIEKCLPIIKINGHEVDYAKFFIKANIAVPTKILWQFTDSTEVSREDRRKLLYLTVSKGTDLMPELDQYKAYFKNLGDNWAKVYESGEKLIVQQDSETGKLFDVLKKAQLLKFTKSKKGIKDSNEPIYIVRAD